MEKLIGEKVKIAVFVSGEGSNQLKKFKGYQDIDRRVPDNSKLKKIIKWKPIYSLEYGLRSMISDLTK